MNTRYVLPGCVAGAVHAVLLFGFTKTPGAAPLPKEPTILTPIVFHAPPEEIPVVERDDAAEPARRPAPTNSAPRSPEPLPTPELPGKPTMEMPVVSPPSLDDTSLIPLSPPGIDVGTGDGPRRTSILSSDRLDNSPRTRFQREPTYPFEARQAGLSGTVVVEFVVDENGRVVEPRVVSSTDRVFEESTLRAVSKWQFEPGRRDGRVVKFRMSVPVVFRVND